MENLRSPSGPQRKLEARREDYRPQCRGTAWLCSGLQRAAHEDRCTPSSREINQRIERGAYRIHYEDSIRRTSARIHRREQAKLGSQHRPRECPDHRRPPHRQARLPASARLVGSGAAAFHQRLIENESSRSLLGKLVLFLRAVLEVAVDRGLIQRNPARKRRAIRIRT